MPFGFITCGPNEALVISGCCYGQPAYIAGGRKFIFPVIQQAQKLSLNVMTLKIESPRIYTQLGVPITVTGVAQVKIKGDSDEMLSRACELFLGKPESEIADIIRNTLEGHQRAMMGNMTVEEIYKDRKKFSKAVFDVATSDFINMGVTIVNYVIKDISDDENYLKSLGKPRTAQVIAEARKGEAEATRDSGIKEALAEQERVAARLENDILIAQAKRDYELKQATYDMEVQTQKCQSDLSYSLQSAKTRQKIKDEEMQIKVVERTRQIQVQELEIVRRERYLDGSVRKPAEAEKYRLQTIAEAEKAQKIKEAQAEAEAVRIKGEADAYAITAKAKAEAEQMAKKAEAFNEFRDAAKLDMLLEALPKVAAELAAPLSQAKKVTLVSSGDGDVGAAKLTGEVLLMMERLPKMINTMTGIDIAKQMKVA